MFSTKGSVTREEVQDMINKSNQNMVQWIMNLEQKNKYLEQQNIILEQKNLELNNYILNLQIKSDETNKLLEKRITDFTDVWHPIMMQNINRIKEELIQTVKLSNKKNNIDLIESSELNNIKSKIDETRKELEKLKKMFDDTGLEGNTVVSYLNSEPRLINTNMLATIGFGNEMFQVIDNFYTFNGKGNSKIVLDKIKYLKGKTNFFDITKLNQKKFYDENLEEFSMGVQNINDKCIDFNGYKFDISGMKKFLKILDNVDSNIKLTYAGSETFNGVLIRKYIELFF